MGCPDGRGGTGPDADWLNVRDARNLILKDVRPPRVERRRIQDALGSALAEHLISPIDLPPWNNSAMDGFAVLSVDIHGATSEYPRRLRVVDDIPAGQFPVRGLSRGEAARIMTGAPVPDGADAVVRIEHTDGGRGIGPEEGSVVIFEDSDANRNVRALGEDLRHGDTVLETGTRLDAACIGVAASIGRGQLEVYSLPTVAILTSGDELVDLDRFDEVLAGRRIVSSNSYTLAGQLAEIGIQPRILGIAADSPESVRGRLEEAQGCDVVITSAGISVGEHDYLKRVLQEMNTEFAFWRVKMRPGSAFGYGRIGDLDGAAWFGLPGNPVSSMVTFEVFVRPALLRMAGHRKVFRPTRRVTLSESLAYKPGYAQFPRARLKADTQGGIRALFSGSQGSGILTSMARADALIYVPEASSGLRAGAEATAIMIGGAPLEDEPGF